MTYLGELLDGGTHDFKFTTVSSTGIPTTLAGTPVISIYKDNNLTQTTAGVTLTADFDGVTGLNHVRLALTDAFYVVDTDYQAVITTGTVGGDSVVGYVVAQFSIANRGVDWGNIVRPTTTVDLSGTDINLVDTTTTNTDMRGTDSALLAASAPTNFGDLSITATTGLVTLAGVVHTGATIPNVTTVATTTTNTDMRGTDSALLASSAPTNFGDLSITATTGLVTLAGVTHTGATIPNVTTVATTTTNTDMRGTDSALLASSAPTNFGDLSIVASTGEVAVGSLTSASITSIRSTVSDTSSAIGTTTTLIDSSRTEANDDHWRGQWILFTSGTAANINQVRLITGFNATTDTLTFTPALNAATASGDGYEILPAARLFSFGRFISNTAVDLPFAMFDSTTKNFATGLTVAVQRSIDEGTYANISGTVAEIGNGTYVVRASAADMNGSESVVFRATATGADESQFTVLLTP
jgi:hypothetical protein